MSVKHGHSKRKRDEIDKLYDQMAVKDMSRAEFRAAYLRVTDPRRMRRDLNSMVLSLGRERTQRAAIEERLRGNES
jgi:hypothetical protein